MNSLAYLTPLVVNIAIAVLIARGKREHSREDGNNEVFFFPAIYCRLLILTSLFLASVPFWPGALGSSNADAAMLCGVAWTLSAASALGALYLHKYFLSVGPGSFTVGSFIKRTYATTEIIHTESVKKQQASACLLQLKGGKRVRISGLLTDFQRLEWLLCHANNEKK